MISFNKTLLMGHLTRDVELRSTSSGSSVAGFGLAVNRKYKKGDDWKTDVCFVDITTWGKQAENCAQYLSRGSGVFVEGYLKMNSWETDSGEKRSKLEIVANTVQFLPKGGNDNQPPDSDIPF